MSERMKISQYPVSNTGIQNTSIMLDYAAFTVENEAKTVERVRGFFDHMDIEHLSYGGMGYDSSAVFGDGGRMYWHTERPEMGFHVRLGAKCLAGIETTAVGLLNRVIDWGGQFTRIDIAFDDMDGLLDMDHMYEKIRLGEVQTRWRKVARMTGGRVGSDEKMGDTVAMGARASQSYLRIYDKKLEQEGKGVDVSGVDSWVRVELELKGDKATAFAKLLAETATGRTQKTAGELCAGLLIGMIDFKDVNPSDENKSRWATSEFWRQFTISSSRLMLSIPKVHRTLDDSKRWVKKSVSTTLAMIILSEDDDRGTSGYEFIIDCIVNGQSRLSKAQQRTLGLWNEQQGEKKTATAFAG